MNPLRDLGYEANDLTVLVSELLVATSDESDTLIDKSVPEVLKLLRDRMKMDVVFVSEFTNGQRVFRYVDTAPGKNVIAAGGSDPLEESWCQRVVDGRLPQFMANAANDPVAGPLAAKLPFPIGTHISAPIVLKDGEVYGTLCSFSFSPLDNPNPSDLQNLRFTAQLTAQKIDRQRALTPKPADPSWALEPLPTSGKKL
ncbi:MAG: GAF domain-containing protein [Polaromonas sp.]|nr:GAF domain-containing protein [Polaromonas sp.]